MSLTLRLFLCSLATALAVTFPVFAQPPEEKLPTIQNDGGQTSPPPQVLIGSDLPSAPSGIGLGLQAQGFYSEFSSGPFQRHFRYGWGGRIGGTMNLLDCIGGNQNLKLDAIFGYNYSHYEGNENYQFSTPGANFRVSSANLHVGDLGLQVRHVRNNLQLTAGLTYNIGGIFTDTQATAFVPGSPTITLAENANTSAFLQGYRARFGADVRLTERVWVGAFYDIGQDFTNALENKTQGSIVHRFGGGVTFLFGGPSVGRGYGGLVPLSSPRIFTR